MKAMIAGSLYDLCLSFVSIGVRKGKEVFLEKINMCGDPWKDRRITLS